ncbi:SDR family NAD(P)-dependent oxidoreductase [Pinisolibacter sp.]|uniref:SDR family NAD(P)-dependent oxidoreductase n=1 Tax=Pinisolibacter sp. TaxID=2172024 RepID=UPI002FDE49E5
MTDRPLDGRIAVVTGASRGIGYVLAREIARAGAHVVALARTVGGLEELDDEIRGFGGTATLVPLDLTDFDALDRLGAALYERHGKLDILVGNAGILGPISPLGHIAPKDWDKVMAVNVTANWRLIRSLDPLLRRSDAGRAVFLSSGAAHRIRAFWGPYAVSKAALEAMVVTWARESEITSIKANLLNPGPLRTAMRAQAMPGEDAETLDRPDVLVPTVMRLISPALEDSGRVWNHPTGDWLA